MSSPDFSTYVDLTIYDRQPADIYAEAIEYARSALPEWDPVVGSVENAIVMAMSLVGGYTAGAINRLPNSIMTALLELYGITRSSGTLATGTAEITFVDGGTYSLPAGLVFAYTDTSGTRPVTYTFQTTEQVVNETGSVEVPIEAMTVAEYPSLLDGQSLRVISPNSSIASVALSADLAVGAGAETDSAFFARTNAILASHSAALVTPDQITQYVLANYTAVYRCKTYSRLDSADVTYTATPTDNGYVTVFVADNNASAVPGGVITTIEEDLRSRMVAGLQVNLLNATTVDIGVNADITVKNGYDSLVVQDAVGTALDQYLHPDHWDWSNRVYYNEVLTLINNVDGVDLVTDMTLVPPLSGTATVGDDITFDDFGVLPTNTHNITVL